MDTTHPENQAGLPGPLLLTLWLALLAGVVEGGYRLFQVLVQHKVILMPLDVIWMAPLANLFWVGVPALVLLGLRRLWPRRVSSTLVAGVLVAIATLPLVLLITSMHKVVAGILAAAIGYQAARILGAHAAGFRRLVRVSVVPLLLLVIAGAAALVLIRSQRYQRAVTSLGEARPGAPNVLLIIWDTVRGQSLSLYGYERPTTPFLETFAREGTRFDRAMVTAPWTLPSHAAMFTGHRPRDVMRSVYEPLVDTFPTLAGALAARGYATAGFVANMAYTTREHGLARDFALYRDHRVTIGTVVAASRLGAVLMDQELPRRLLGFWDQLDRKNAAEVNSEFLAWLDRRPEGRPFFAFLNYFDAHRPYIAVEPYKSQFVRDSSGRFYPRLEHLNWKDASRDEIAWMQDNYDAAIAYQDEQVRLLVAELGRRGLLDNTLVIISSDHGEHWGDHNRLGHMNSLHRQLLQVPLVMRLPGRVPADGVVLTPVTLADLPRTILDLAGMADTAGIPGTSMTRYWKGTDPGGTAPDPVLLAEIGTRKGRGPFSFFAQGYHYINWHGRARDDLLYDVAADPFETDDLSERPELAATRAAFEQLVFRLIGPDALEPLESNAGDEDTALPQ